MTMIQFIGQCADRMASTPEASLRCRPAYYTRQRLATYFGLLTARRTTACLTLLTLSAPSSNPADSRSTSLKPLSTSTATRTSSAVMGSAHLAHGVTAHGVGADEPVCLVAAQFAYFPGQVLTNAANSFIRGDIRRSLRRRFLSEKSNGQAAPRRVALLLLASRIPGSSIDFLQRLVTVLVISQSPRLPEQRPLRSSGALGLPSDRYSTPATPSPPWPASSPYHPFVTNGVGLRNTHLRG